MVGYTGGSKANPTYRKMGDHTESIRVWYDEKAVTYEELLTVFFNNHSYGHKASRQYRSAIFVLNDEQRRSAEAHIARLGGKVATAVEQATEWTDAEEYHQKYVEKNRRRRGW